MNYIDEIVLKCIGSVNKIIILKIYKSLILKKSKITRLVLVEHNFYFSVLVLH